MEELQKNISNEVVLTKNMDFFQRVIGIIISPSETIQCLIEKPRILFPILLLPLSILGFYLVRLDVFKEFAANMVEIGIQSKNVQLEPAQLEMAKKTGWISMLVAAPIGSLVMWLVMCAILLGIVKIFKGEGKFQQILSITGYSHVIMLIYYILSIGVSFFTNNLMMDSSLANITNLFLPNIKGTYLYGIFRSIDFFTIWQYSVIAIGITLVSKFSKSKVYTIVGLIYIASILYAANSYKFM